MKTYSLFAAYHEIITEHHIALLLGILYSLASEAVPYFPEKVNFFGTQPVYNRTPSFEPYIDLQLYEYKNNKLYVQGIGILTGVACPTYDDVEYILVLESDSGEIYEKELAKTHAPHLTRVRFNGDLVNYDKCLFTTRGYEGVDISDIPKGKYTLSLTIKTNVHTATHKIISQNTLSYSTDNYILYCDNHICKLQYSTPSFEPYIDLHLYEYKNDKLYIQGIGILRGVACPTYDSVDYALVFESESGEIYEKELAKDHASYLTRNLFNDDLVNYDKCLFTTKAYEGVDISDIPKGKYTLSLTIKTNLRTATHKIISRNTLSYSTDNYILRCDSHICTLQHI